MIKSSSNKTAAGKGVSPKKKTTSPQKISVPKSSPPSTAPKPVPKKQINVSRSFLKQLGSLINTMLEQQQPVHDGVGRIDPHRKIHTKKKAKKNVLQDSAYYSKIGKRGGKVLAKERGPEYYSEIARLSHPRKEYLGGRPKGSKNKKKKT